MRRKLALVAAGLVATGVMASAMAETIEAGGKYVDVDGSTVSVWSESNGAPGLQKVATEDLAADTQEL